MPPRISQIVLDEGTWAAAPQRRRQEWRSVLDDLAADHVLGAPALAAIVEPLRLRVTWSAVSVLLELHGSEGVEVARVEIATRDMAAHLKDYIAICEQIGRLRASPHSPRWEALDIAKRLAHDEAGEALLRLCAPLGIDLQTGRRLFTVLVALQFDTTRLALPAHVH